MANRVISFNFERKNLNGTRVKLSPRTRDTDVMIRNQTAFLDSAIEEYDDHIGDNAKHVCSAITTGTSSMLMAEIPGLVLDENIVIVLKLHIDASPAPKFNLNEFGDYPIITSDLNVMVTPPRKDNYIMISWNDTLKSWVGINYFNRPKYLTVTKVFDEEVTEFILDEYNRNFDEVISINFNQILLRPEIDYTISDINKFSLLGSVFFKAGEMITVVILKNIKVNLNVHSNYVFDDELSEIITSSMVNSWNEAVTRSTNNLVDIVDIENSMTDLVEKTETFESDITAMNGTISTISEKVDTVKSTVDTIAGTIINVNDKVNELEEDISELSPVAKSGRYEDLTGEIPMSILNVIDGNSEGAIRSSGAKSDYVMGEYSQAFGLDTIASGISSHAEGRNTKSTGDYSHAEGYNSTASELYSHAEGIYTKAGYASHAEGTHNIADGGSLVFKIKSITISGEYSTIALDTEHKSYTLLRFNMLIVDNPVYLRRVDTNPMALSSSKIISIDADNSSFKISPITSGTYDFIVFPQSSSPLNTSHAEGEGSIASSRTAHAEGLGSIAFGTASHAEGSRTLAYGEYSHAEGYNTTSLGAYSHAEGMNTISQGSYSHSEGNKTLAVAQFSHSEGSNTSALAPASHAEGNSTIANGNYSHAEGSQSKTFGTAGHAEGTGSLAFGPYGSHAEGNGSISAGDDSAFKILSFDNDTKTLSLDSTFRTSSTYFTKLKIGMVCYIRTRYYGNAKIYQSSITAIDSENYTLTFEGLSLTISEIISSLDYLICPDITNGEYYASCHAEGRFGAALGPYSHSEGGVTSAIGEASHAEGYYTIASGDYSHAEAFFSQATGHSSHCEGSETKASGYASHSEGGSTTARGDFSHAEGSKTQAIGKYSHSEGLNTLANGSASHSEGADTLALGSQSHSEGQSTAAYGNYSHAEGRNTTASASASHAEGYNTTTSGIYSHAEGYYTFSNGTSSHAEGASNYAGGSYTHVEGAGNVAITDNNALKIVSVNAYSKQITLSTDVPFDNVDKLITGDILLLNTHSSTGISDYVLTISEIDISNNTITVSGATLNNEMKNRVMICQRLITDVNKSGAHAEGICNIAINTSHAEGLKCGAIGHSSHAEGTLTMAMADSSHAEGAMSIALGIGSHAEGNETQANGQYSHSEGWNTISNGATSHAEGLFTKTMGDNAHAEGQGTLASGESSHAEGNTTTASGQSSHAEGYKTVASASYTHAEGSTTTASGSYSHAEGYYTTASGQFSHAEGSGTTAAGSYSHVANRSTTAETLGLTTIGCYNKVNSGSPSAFSSTQNAFVIGNGTDTSAKSNCFRVDFSGNVYGLSAFKTTGADYGEYFEWDDLNLDNEDRIGHFVSLTETGNIKIATPDEDVIGVVSGNCSIVGNSFDDTWQAMYVKDIYGRQLYEDVEVDEFDEEGNVINTITEHRMKLNPEYDPNEEYIPRKDRQEWDIIGLMGQIIVIDDGTCVVGKKCNTNEEGIATIGDKYRVIKRLDESHIVVLASFL